MDEALEPADNEWHFDLPVSHVRKGDTVYYQGEWQTVVESHQYLGDPSVKPLPLWIVSVLISEAKWDWQTYPTYGAQPNDEYDGPKTIIPWECCNELAFFSWDEKIRVSVDSGVVALTPDLLPVRWWVNVYEVDKGYGGAEEGGWWFDTGELIRTVACRSYDQARRVQERLSVLFPSNGSSSSVVYRGGDYAVRLDEYPGRDYPERKPHYS